MPGRAGIHAGQPVMRRLVPSNTAGSSSHRPGRWRSGTRMAESVLTAALFGVTEMEQGSAVPGSAEQRRTEQPEPCNAEQPRETGPIERTDEFGHCVLFNARALEPPATPATHPVFFFDLDNTIYPKSSGIDHMMARRIELFFTERLRLPLAQARELGARYYRDYGLSIRGLMRDFAISPAEYDAYVDCGLALEGILRPDPALQASLRRLNQQHGPCWVFTNAGKQHALRVLRLLGLDSAQYLQGVIYCDYAEPDFPAKPDRAAFERAMRRCGVRADDPNDRRRCVFIDDALGNVRVARDLGWQVVHVNEAAESLASELGTLSPVAPVDMLTVRAVIDVERVLLAGVLRTQQ